MLREWISMADPELLVPTESPDTVASNISPVGGSGVTELSVSSSEQPENTDEKKITATINSFFILQDLF